MTLHATKRPTHEGVLHTMQSRTFIFALLTGLLYASALRIAEAQTTAPTIGTTQSSAPVTPRRAEVTYSAGQLTVRADNSSLNQVLHDISRQTGMKITGGVNEERVFGTYGPEAPSKVLTALLEGTGSNVLLVQSPSSEPSAAPIELVLTPRHGGPTPPNPNAPGFNDAVDPQVDPQGDSSRVPPASQPVAPPQSGPSAGAPTAPPTTGTADDTGTTQDQSPNGVKTPQQIYEQLLKLRQQSQPK